MVKLLKMLALAMLLMAFAAGTAMAAGSITAVSKVIDYKLMTGDSFRLSGGTLGAMTYTTGTNFGATNTFNLVISGASWGNSTAITMTGATTSGNAAVIVYSCTPVVGEKTCLMSMAGTALGAVGTGRSLSIGYNVAGVVTPPDILVAANLGATNKSDVTTLAVADVVGTGAATSGATTILSVAEAATLTLTGTQDANGRIIDTGNARKTFTTTFAGSNRNTGTSLVWTAPGADIYANTNLAGFKVTLGITGDFTGISAIGWGTGGSTSACYTSTSCTATLATQTGNNMGGTKNLVFTSDNSTALSPRVFTISSVDITAVGEKSDPISFSAEKSGMTITLTSNGFSALLPGLVYDPTGVSYGATCYINNPGTTSTVVDVDLLNAYTGVTGAGSSGTVGYYPSVVTVPAKGTAMLKIAEGNKNIVPYLWNGSSAQAGTATVISQLGDWDKFAIKITLTGTAGSSNATISCLQKDPAGAQRAMTVLTESKDSSKQ